MVTAATSTSMLNGLPQGRQNRQSATPPHSTIVTDLKRIPGTARPQSMFEPRDHQRLSRMVRFLQFYFHVYNKMIFIPLICCSMFYFFSLFFFSHIFHFFFVYFPPLTLFLCYFPVCFLKSFYCLCICFHGPLFLYLLSLFYSFFFFYFSFSL